MKGLLRFDGAVERDLAARFLDGVDNCP